MDLDPLFDEYAFFLISAGATEGEMQTFETYALLLNAELEIAEDPSLIEAAYADFLVAFMLEKSDGSETKPDKKTFPPGSTGTDRTPKQGDQEDKRAADREKKALRGFPWHAAADSWRADDWVECRNGYTSIALRPFAWPR
jgi:hypothetical protein